MDQLPQSCEFTVEKAHPLGLVSESGKVSEVGGRVIVTWPDTEVDVMSEATAVPRNGQL